MKKKRKLLFLGLGAVAVLVIIIAIAVSSKRKNDNAFHRKIKTAAAEYGDISVMVTEIGTIEPKVRVEVKSKLGGKVVKLLSEEGEQVDRDQVLALVEPDINDAQILAQIKNNLKKSRFSMDEALRNLENERELHGKGFSSEDELRARELYHEEARINCTEALDQYRILVQSGIPVDDSETGIQKINVVSPIEGVLIGRYIEEGEMVTSGLSSFNAGTVLFTVADLSRMIVRAAINEVDVGKLTAGQEVTISVDAFPGKRFAGTITYISLAAREEERVKVFDIEIELGVHGLIGSLRTGMTANLEIAGEHRENILRVPIGAVFKKRDRDIVYVRLEADAVEGAEGGSTGGGQSADDTTSAGSGLPVSVGEGEEWKLEFEEREVTIGLVDLDNVEILAGLSAGEEVTVEDPTVEKEDEEN